MRFLESISDAILNRSPEELIGALLIAAAVAIVAAGLYALCRRKSSPSPTFMGGLGLAAGASCMALAAGYIEYTETDTTTAVYPRIAYRACRRCQEVQAETQQRTPPAGKPL
jgi:hypothetical protein